MAVSSNNNLVRNFDGETNENLKLTLRSVEEVPQCILISLKGYVDTYNSKFFQGRVSLAIEAGYTRLIFDCAELTYLSSTGIGLFTAFLKTVKQKEGDIVLVAVQPKVLEIFKLLGFDRFFKICESVGSSYGIFQAEKKLELSGFPVVFLCPVCKTKLKAEKHGRFRCSGCKTILSVNEDKSVSLG